MRRPERATTLLNRRDALALCAGMIGAGARTAAAETRTPAPTSLAAAARAGHTIFGAAGGEELFRDAAYRALFVREAAILTPDHALKFDALQPEQGRFAFETADTLIDGARRNGLMVHGHTLFWNDWPPHWLKALSSRETERVFETYLDTVVPHFAGRLQSWDVVNEPFWLGRDKPGTFRPGPWYNALGADYIFRAFRRTAELDPGVKLVLNEAWTERNDPVGLAVRRSLLALIDRMQDKGIRLDAIGLQGHLTPQIPYDDKGFGDFLHQIAARGLDIYITEFDIDDESYPGDESARDKAVAARTMAFLDIVLSVPAVKAIMCWGLSDRYSWWREPSTMAAHGLTRLARPLPFDDRFERKPMWFAMADAFSRRGRER